MRAALTPSRRAVLAALAAAAPSPAAAQTLRDLVEPREPFGYAFAAGARSTGWLPLEPGDNLILRAELDGAPVRIVLDSGASLSLVDLNVARRLKLGVRGAQRIDDGVGLSSRGLELQPATFTIGGLTLTGVRLIAADLSALADVGGEAPVILGREAFERLVVDIDVSARRLAFHAPGAFSPIAGARSLPLTRASKATRVAPVAVEGLADIPAQFDLGSQSPLVASQAFAQAHGWFSGRPTSTWIAASVVGISLERTSTVQGVSLAGFALPPTPLEAPSAWGVADAPLLVGLPLLSRFRLTADYAADRLWLSPDAAALAAPFRRNRSGLACKPAGSTLEVLHVAVGSPAAQGGWRVGDRIAAVDGAAAISARGFGDGPVGLSLALTLAGGERRRLTLADYF